MIIALRANEAIILYPENPTQASEISTVCMHTSTKTLQLHLSNIACFFFFCFFFNFFIFFLFLFIYLFLNLLMTSEWLIYGCIKIAAINQYHIHMYNVVNAQFSVG